ncbi:type 1 glutamine amidotransferase [Xinfangfangia pollutisoli]|uniref:type 1 glutamine amidotransferase n=1 Tax=Xinfangfangia pollutisoli TaxID=2865960 RepID=UPI001CD3AC41|nr:type 1 glutamine amidotransferase [Xinfangfangia pollutisoli]
MRVTIVENTRITHHGQVGVALHEAAARIEILRPWAGEPLPATLASDALVVFGGEQSALADDTHPYLPQLARLMADAAGAGKAVLGVCLGAQLFARGLGARNVLGTAPEFGWCEVTRSDVPDPLLGALPRSFPIFQWHSDTFTLPPGATRLAGSAQAENQSFRFGRAGYATQFHFEASRAVVADWSREFPDLVERLSPGWHAAHPALAAGPGLQADAHGLALARAWVGLIG